MTDSNVSYVEPHGLKGYYPGTNIRLANGFERLGAALVDWGPLVLVYGGPWMNTFDHLWFDVPLLIYLAFSNVILQTLIGQSVGKRLFQLYLVLPVMTLRQGNYFCVVSPLRLVLRILAHLIDAFPWFPFVSWGYFAPFVTVNRKTFADVALRTVVLAPNEPITNLVRRPWRGTQTMGRRRG
jgi:hypothetical protein